MKPRAPELTPDTQQPSLEAELGRLCDAKAGEGRVTVPAPPSAEVLRAATPLPPEPPAEATPESPRAAPTTPAPPVRSQVVRSRADSDEEPEAQDAVIPPPPRLPRISGG